MESDDDEEFMDAPLPPLHNAEEAPEENQVPDNFENNELNIEVVMSDEESDDGNEENIEDDTDASELSNNESSESEHSSDEENEGGWRDRFLRRLRAFDERFDSDDHDEEPAENVQRQVTFDRSLPGRHDYLGGDLEEVRGRLILEDETIVSLPMLALPGVVLMPGQTLPLHVFPHHTVAMLLQVRDTDRTLAIVTSYTTHAHSTSMSRLGTTAEIQAMKEETDEAAGISNVKLKAVGRQRFEVIDTRRQTDGILRARVRILPERILPDPLQGAHLESVRRRCTCLNLSQSSDQQQLSDEASGGGDGNKAAGAGRDLADILKSALECSPKRTKRDPLRSAHMTWWPPWVYKQYDERHLMERLKAELASWNMDEAFPSQPIEFSHWLAAMLPLDDHMKLQILSLDHAVPRMRYMLSVMHKCSVLCCASCQHYIANKQDVFSLTLGGPMAAYVNPGGYVHETLTIYRAQGLNLVGHPSTENSWFPGYAWTIAQCRSCHRHMGWKFTAAKRGLKPEKFWGLTRSALQPALSQTDEQFEEGEGGEGRQWLPVM